MAIQFPNYKYTTTSTWSWARPFTPMTVGITDPYATFYYQTSAMEGAYRNFKMAGRSRLCAAIIAAETPLLPIINKYRGYETLSSVQTQLSVEAVGQRIGFIPMDADKWRLDGNGSEMESGEKGEVPEDPLVFSSAGITTPITEILNDIDRITEHFNRAHPERQIKRMSFSSFTSGGASLLMLGNGGTDLGPLIRQGADVMAVDPLYRDPTSLPSLGRSYDEELEFAARKLVREDIEHYKFGHAQDFRLLDPKTGNIRQFDEVWAPNSVCFLREFDSLLNILDHVKPGGYLRMYPFSVDKGFALLLNEFLRGLKEKGAIRVFNEVEAGKKTYLIIEKASVPPKKGSPRAPKMTRKQAAAVKLRLDEFTFEEISEELGIDWASAYGRVERALYYLNPSTVTKLKTRGNKRRREMTKTLQLTAHTFLTELSKPGMRFWGAKTRTASKFGIDKATVADRLRTVGINISAEIKRRIFEFMLDIADTMDLSIEESAQKLQCHRWTVFKYRKKVAGLEHLRGALELVGTPEADEWWNFKTPATKGRIKLALRDDSVRKDIKFFDQAIGEAKKLMLKWHPDAEVNRGDKDAEERFKVANRHRDALQKARERYIEKEQEFRKWLGLPQLVLT